MYDHHMLVIDVYSANSFRVIHYSSLVERGPGQEAYSSALDSYGLQGSRDENGGRAPLGVVLEETLTVKEEDFKDMCVLKYPEGVQLFSVEESITRARSRLNEKEYNLITNNCECFVNWAITGEAVSYQIVSGTAAALKGAAKHAKEAYEKGGSLFGVVGNGLLGAVVGYLEHRNTGNSPYNAETHGDTS